MNIEQEYLQKVQDKKCAIIDHIDFFSELNSMLTSAVRRMKWSNIIDIKYANLPSDFTLNVYSCIVINQMFEGGCDRYQRILESTVSSGIKDNLSEFRGMNAYHLQTEMKEMLSVPEDKDAIMMLVIERNWEITPLNRVDGCYYLKPEYKKLFPPFYKAYCNVLRRANFLYRLATEGKIVNLAKENDGYIFHSESEPFDSVLKIHYLKSIGQETPMPEDRKKLFKRLSNKLKGEHISYTNNYMLDLLGLEL